MELVVFLTRRNSAGQLLAPKTILSDRAALIAAFRAARRRGLVVIDPAVDLRDEVAPKNETVRSGRWLSTGEARELLESCDDSDSGHRDRTLLTLGLLTGLRRANLASLRWGQIDLPARQLRVAVKGRKALTLGINPQVYETLEKWHIRYEAAVGRPVRTSDPVIPKGYWDGMESEHVLRWGEPITPDGVGDIIRRRGSAAGVPVATHDLRRSFNGFMQERNVPLEMRAQAMGHSSVDTTARVYDRKNPRAAMDAVADLSL